MKLYQDNRNIRDNGYEGDLIIETGTFGVSKEEALSTMKNILEKDADNAERMVEKYQRVLNKCRRRLTEFPE